MTRGVEWTEAEKEKKKLCHKNIKRCCDSPALSRRYEFRGSASVLLARSPGRPNVTCSADSDDWVSSDEAKVGLFPFTSPKPGKWERGGGEGISQG